MVGDGSVVDGGSMGGSVVDGGLVGGDWKFSSGSVGGSVVNGGVVGGHWKFLSGSGVVVLLMVDWQVVIGNFWVDQWVVVLLMVGLSFGAGFVWKIKVGMLGVL